MVIQLLLQKQTDFPESTLIRPMVLLLQTESIFMKANAKQNAAFFTAEAAGLTAIEKTGAIGTPEILCTGTDDGEDVGKEPVNTSFRKN